LIQNLQFFLSFIKRQTFDIGNGFVYGFTVQTGCLLDVLDLLFRWEAQQIKLKVKQLEFVVAGEQRIAGD